MDYLRNLKNVSTETSIGDKQELPPGDQGLAPGYQELTPGNQGLAPGNQELTPGNQGLQDTNSTDNQELNLEEENDHASASTDVSVEMGPWDSQEPFMSSVCQTFISGSNFTTYEHQVIASIYLESVIPAVPAPASTSAPAPASVPAPLKCFTKGCDCDTVSC